MKWHEVAKSRSTTFARSLQFPTQIGHWTKKNHVEPKIGRILPEVHVLRSDFAAWSGYLEMNIHKMSYVP